MPPRRLHLALPLLLGCLAFLPACGTVTSGVYQRVDVATDPAGAVIRIDGVRHGTTPATLQLPKRRDAVLSLQLDGYETQTITLQSTIDGSVAETLVKGGVVGGAVDLASGAAFRLVPESVQVALRPAGPLPAAARAGEPSSALRAMPARAPGVTLAQVDPAAAPGKPQPRPARAGEPRADSAGDPSTIAARLRALEDLRREGLVDDVEYRRMRQSLLARLGGAPDQAIATGEPAGDAADSPH